MNTKYFHMQRVGLVGKFTSLELSTWMDIFGSVDTTYISMDPVNADYLIQGTVSQKEWPSIREKNPAAVIVDKETLEVTGFGPEPILFTVLMEMKKSFNSSTYFEDIREGRPFYGIGYHWESDPATDAQEENHASRRGFENILTKEHIDPAKEFFICDHENEWGGGGIAHHHHRLYRVIYKVTNPLVRLGQEVDFWQYDSPLLDARRAGFDSIFYTPAEKFRDHWPREGVLLNPADQIISIDLLSDKPAISTIMLPGNKSILFTGEEQKYLEEAVKKFKLMVPEGGRVLVSECPTGDDFIIKIYEPWSVEPTLEKKIGFGEYMSALLPLSEFTVSKF